MEWRISGLRQETEDTITYFLNPIKETGFTYQAGQFLTILFNINDRKIRRSYSFSSTPGTDKYPSLTIKRIPNGEVSRYIHDYWNVGTIIETLNPSGRFVLEPIEKEPRDIFLLAAGSGITPIYSLLQQALTSDKASKVHLLYSNKTQRSTILYQQILEWKERFPENLEIIFFFSDSKRLEMARLTKYVLEEIVSRRHYFPLQNAIFFLCGPHEYMQMAGIELRSMGIAPEKIRREVYEVTLVSPPKWELSDKSPKEVTIHYQRNDYKFTVPHNKSILDVALENGIELPYSCRSGKCSACAARCVRGKVVMSYNEVLTERDENEGVMLTCTGHPLTSDVEITY
jgi:ring-1,2-phenylacetyl-CoA epoxidase subunit PaaE